MELHDRLKENEELLESILRGAAKILGCSSANLIAFNTKTREVRIQVGAILEKYAKVRQLEDAAGNSFQSMVFRMEDVEDSLVYAAWRDRTAYETASLIELVGSIFPGDLAGLAEQGPQLIGEHRFICVPVLCGQRIFGVIIFTKEDPQPFGVQQREILLRYAQRIGEIIEYDLSHRQNSPPSERIEAGAESVLRYLIFDGSGGLCFWSAAPSEDAALHSALSRGGDAGHGLPEPVIPEVGRRAAGLLSNPSSTGESFHLAAPDAGWNVDEKICVRLRADLVPIRMGGGTYALCTLFGMGMRSKHFIHTQLLYFALGETAPALLLDPTFRITSCNEATEQLFGYPAMDLLHRPIGDLFRNAKDIETILGHQFLFSASGYYEDRTELRHKSGRIFAGKVEALLLADEVNQIIGFMVLIRETRAQGSEEHGENIQLLMRRERLATMGEMAAQLAHELRNPLVSIGATLEMLGKEDGRDPESREILATLSDEVTHMDTLLKDYLSLAARRNAPVTKVDLSQALDDAMRLLRGAREAEGKVVENLLPRNIEVLADYDGMRHVFLNLLRNALEATPPGRRVTCHALSDDRGISVFIDDQGTGLTHPAGECFQSFFTTKKNGTGLGLTVCQKAIQAFGGSLSLENLETGGCRAMIVLPKKVWK